MTWEVNLISEVEDWFKNLTGEDSDQVTAAIDMLEEHGPGLGRPLVDSLKGTTKHHLKELRTGTIRILFAFDPERNAVLLVGGDKRGTWSAWYRENIPVAEDRYGRWLAGEYEN